MKESIAMSRRRAPAAGLTGLFLAAVVSFPGCFSFQGEPFPAGLTAPVETGALGSFTLASPILGGTTLTPAECRAGDLQHFLGGDFVDPGTGLVVRLAVDPIEGPAARVFASAEPFAKSVVLRRSECEAFHFSLEWTGLTINDVRDYRISLELHCVLADGTSVHGSASSTHCH
mgnify:CR=1 FL=1